MNCWLCWKKEKKQCAGREVWEGNLPAQFQMPSPHSSRAAAATHASLPVNVAVQAVHAYLLRLVRQCRRPLRDSSSRLSLSLSLSRSRSRSISPSLQAQHVTLIPCSYLKGNRGESEPHRTLYVGHLVKYVPGLRQAQAWNA